LAESRKTPEWIIPVALLAISIVMAATSWLFVQWIESERARAEETKAVIQNFLFIVRDHMLETIKLDAEQEAELKGLEERIGRLSARVEGRRHEEQGTPR